MLSPDRSASSGSGRTPDFEAQVLSDSRLPVVDVQMAASDPLRSARAALSALSACDGLAVHFDVDLVKLLDAPLAENTDRGIAPSLTACGEMLSELLVDELLQYAVTEFNPHHGSKDGSTTQRLLEILVSCLGSPP